ncbi:D-lactaldehyde dehydrogenase [Ramaria rubella]|nr:D-lactaldehyde dehydrogenase [Ramaria rubella]
MPAIKPGSKVLVTGASGFIAAWIIKTLLEQKFYVRGTVRSVGKGNYLRNIYNEYAGCFEYIVTGDMAKEGAFDEAVKGMDAVIHTASPVTLQVDDPDELIIPAVKGTNGILESILNHGRTVRRVEILSSMATIIQPAIPGRQLVLTEKFWNEDAAQQVRDRGRKASPLDKYRASKTLAERAAWEFAEKHKKDIEWDVVTFNPPYVWGPTLHEIPSASSINTSLVDVYALIKGRIAPTTVPLGNWTDVRDLATAHVKALVVEQAGGERFIISSGPYTWQDFLDSIHSGARDRGLLDIPTGTPGAGKNVTHPILLDTTQVRTILKLEFRGMEEMAKDTARSLLEREKSQEW